MNRYAYVMPYVPFAEEVRKIKALRGEVSDCNIRADRVSTKNSDDMFEWEPDGSGDWIGENLDGTASDTVMNEVDFKNADRACSDQVSTNKNDDKDVQNLFEYEHKDRVSMHEISKNSSVFSADDVKVGDVSGKNKPFEEQGDRVRTEVYRDFSSVRILYELLMKVCGSESEKLSSEIYLNLTV